MVVSPIRLLEYFLVNLVVIAPFCVCEVLRNERHDYSFSTEDVMMCFRMRNEPIGTMVMGLTKNCYVFYGIMPDMHNLSQYRVLDLESDGAAACSEKNVFLMRAYGEDQTMIVLVDRYGKKVRVQSAFSKTPKYTRAETGNFIWHYVNPNNMLEQFYSNSVDPGFTIAGFHYFRRHVLVYAVSHGAVRLYDLFLRVRRNYITPYLELLSEPDFQLFLPQMDTKIRQDKNYPLDSPTIVIQQGDALLSIPLRNLIFKSYRGVSPVFGNDRLSFDTSNQSVDMACAGIHPVLAFGRLNMTPEQWVLHVSTRRWVNPMNAHRRMAYPHAIKRMQHHHFFSEGWVKAVPIVIVTISIALTGTLVFLRLVGFYMKEYEMRRFNRLNVRDRQGRHDRQDRLSEQQ